ncbi:hypothetical protein BLNAU_6751 [Blattamonas nauphoetae]|uniref:Uncharacterized protein n=1 Tax=Blattamonas nauphoetae TaxID=2049346 RepID=A0ABQ9Y3H4_9EUKA|nr:hypothetical protein BLNAU_6751 [Blattamonas nauphoetae]
MAEPERQRLPLRETSPLPTVLTRPLELSDIQFHNERISDITQIIQRQQERLDAQEEKMKRMKHTMDALQSIITAQSSRINELEIKAGISKQHQMQSPTQKSAITTEDIFIKTETDIPPEPAFDMTKYSFSFSDVTCITQNGSLFTRTDAVTDEDGDAIIALFQINEPFQDCIVNLDFTLIKLPEKNYSQSVICFGFCETSESLPTTGQQIGGKVNNSLCINSATGCLRYNTTHLSGGMPCTRMMKEGDNLRLELDLLSPQRKAIFFLNDRVGDIAIVDIPTSVKVMFSMFLQNSCFRINNIAVVEQPTKLKLRTKKFKW